MKKIFILMILSLAMISSRELVAFVTELPPLEITNKTGQKIKVTINYSALCDGGTPCTFRYNPPAANLVIVIEPNKLLDLAKLDIMSNMDVSAMTAGAESVRYNSLTIEEVFTTGKKSIVPALKIVKPKSKNSIFIRNNKFVIQ